MPIEFTCNGCQSNLRVPDEYGGKQAKCPSCNHVNSIPTAPKSEPTVPDLKSHPTVVDKTANNPYSSTIPGPSPTASSVETANSTSYPFQPLYDSLFFLKFLAWYFIITGGLACVTILGAIYGWLPLWIGICLKNACRDLENGYQSRNAALLHNASRNLATVAKIIAVMSMIGVAFFALYILIIIFVVIAGVIGGIANS